MKGKSESGNRLLTNPHQSKKKPFSQVCYKTHNRENGFY